MIFLADFSVIKPDFGLLFWTSIIFLLFWLLMYKFAFGPITEALKTRQTDIQNALDEAKKAKEEMASLNARNEELIKEAQSERAKIMKEAKEVKEQIIAEAKVKAKEDANRIVTTAKMEIEGQKKAALLDAKNQIGQMALTIAEKVIRKDLSANPEQVSFVDKLVKEIKMN